MDERHAGLASFKSFLCAVVLLSLGLLGLGPCDRGSQVRPGEIIGGDVPSQPGSAAEAEQIIKDMINQVRVNKGLSRLESNATLDAIASRHSADMAKYNFVGHDSPVHGGPAARLRLAGLPADIVLENVAVDSDVLSAMSLLLTSPSHASAIFSTEVDSMGVGVALKGSGAGRQYFITQIFARLN